jgi:CHAT domain
MGCKPLSSLPAWLTTVIHSCKVNPMDPATLTTFLAPFLPYLLQLGNKAAETAAGKFGEDAWSKAKVVWNKLQPKVEAKAAAQEAVADVAESPEDEDYQAALRVQLKKLLENDAILTAALAQIMQRGASAPQTQITQNVKGDRNQVVGQVVGGTVFGNIQGNVIYGTTGSSADTPTAASKPAPPKTILILAANPKGTSPLRLDQEVRDIQRGLDRASHRDHFTLQQRWAVTAQDVRRALLDCQPQIVHFSGHGLGSVEPSDPQPTRKLTPVTDNPAEVEGLMLEDATGQPQLVSSQALADLFALFAGQIECVLLNACYSATQATAIAQHIPYVIGMKRAIGDQAAIEFAIGFYDAVLAGRSIEFAYKLGCNAIRMAGIPEHLTPVLKQK